jgi:hypothetical protein
MVRVPPGMLAAAVLLWGWHQEAMAWAVLAALAVEAARVAPFRWDFDDADFHRLGDVTGVGLVLLAVVQFGDRGLTGIYGVLRWMPLVILGLLLAQLYSTRRAVKLSAIFLSVRLALRRGRLPRPGELDMRLPFLVACLLSACAGSAREQWAVTAAGAVLVWLLWSNRPQQVARVTVLGALLLCVTLVAAGQAGVTAVRHALGPIIMDIVRERMAHWRDPFRNYTALGEIGRIKVSDRIVLRVEAPPGTPVPALLTEATYTHFSNNVWLAGRADFDALTPGADGTRWDVAGDQRPFRLVTVAKSLIRNKGMLAAPTGVFRIDDLPVEELHASPLGALKVIQGPALVRYSVRYAEDGGSRSEPQERDLAVPQRLVPLMRRTLDGLGLRADATSTQIVARLQRYFVDGFGYTLDLSRDRRWSTTRWRNSSSARGRVTASTSPPRRCCCCARPACRPVTPPATRCGSGALWRAPGWCGGGTPTPGRRPGSGAAGWTSTPPPQRGWWRMRPGPPGGSRPTIWCPSWCTASLAGAWGVPGPARRSRCCFGCWCPSP